MTKTKASRFRTISVLDWIIFIVLATVCFLCFQQSDLRHTAGSSFGYLNGHILDFYDYNATFDLGDSYMPSTYLLFAIWNIPLKLLGLASTPTKALSTSVLMWNKLLPTLFFLMSGLLVYRILLLLKAQPWQAKVGAYVFLSSPIAFFSQFIFGQYDSLTLFFMLAGIYYWIKDRRIPFILCFGFSLTFKYTALLVFVPLLLLREKRYGRIILSGLLVALPILAMIGLYLPSESFRHYVFGFGAVNYVLSLTVKTTYFPISVIIVLWLLICGAAFFQDCESKAQLCQWGVFLSSLVCFLMFGLCQWHPQWLMFMTPFLVFGALYHKKAKDLLFIDLLLMVAYVYVTVSMWANHVDQQLIEWGVLQGFLQAKGGFNLMMRDILFAPPLVLTFSTFVGILLIVTVFKHPKYLVNHFSESMNDAAAVIRLRFIGGVAVFVVPALICFGVLLNQPDLIYETGSTSAVLPYMTEDSVVRQYFTTEDVTLAGLAVYGDFAEDSEKEGKLLVELRDADTDELIAQGSYDIVNFISRWRRYIPLSKAALSSSRAYYAEFRVEALSKGTQFALYRTSSGSATETNHALVDGEAANYSLCMDLYGTSAQKAGGN